MSVVSAEILLALAVLVLVAVAAGTLSARFFMAASRAHVRGSGSAKDL